MSICYGYLKLRAKAQSYIYSLFLSLISYLPHLTFTSFFHKIKLLFCPGGETGTMHHIGCTAGTHKTRASAQHPAWCWVKSLNIFTTKIYLAGMAELVDAQDLKSCDRKVMRVRFSLPAIKATNYLIGCFYLTKNRGGSKIRVKVKNINLNLKF